jgi:subtilisin family serine protease
VLPLSVQAFDVTHGDKLGKDEGKQLASLFVRHIQKIQNVMSADLSDVQDVNQIRFESVIPKNLNLQPDVSVKFDVQVKAFDMDIVGIFDQFHKFFDRSDRLQTTMWVNEHIKIFSSFKTEDKQRSIGPWWIEQQRMDEKATVEAFAHSFVLDFYKTQVRWLEGLDGKSFASFVTGLDHYQTYVRTRKQNPAKAGASLGLAHDIFQMLVNDNKSSAIVYSYLGSVLSIQSKTEDAIKAYDRALELNPDDAFATRARDVLRAVNALKPKVAETTVPAVSLEKISRQRLAGYDSALVPAAKSNVTIAVLATGISPELSEVLGGRLAQSINLVPSETIDDQFGHGTAVISLAAALAPSASFISIKVISNTGGGDMMSVAAGVKRAIETKAKVILLPLGTSMDSPPVAAVIAEAIKAGSLVIAAAGNERAEEPAFPARVDGVMAIGAVDASDNKASFSNSGAKVLYAPGVDILVLGNSGTVTQSGTSFAATIASAMAASLWAANPQLTAGQLQDRLKQASVEIRSSGPKGTVSIRRLDMTAATPSGTP